MIANNILAYTLLMIGAVHTVHAVADKYISSCYSEDEAKQQAVVRRGAFDIGSGDTKITVADVDTKTNRITQIWHSTFKTVALRKDMAASKDKSLSPKIQRELISTINDMKDKVSQYNPVQWSAVGTSVFRTAVNGPKFLKEVEAETGLTISLLPQEEEGRIGFASAIAASNESLENVIAWDSGSGSFQISTLIGGKLQVYGAEFAYVPALQALFTLRGQPHSLDKSPNPVSTDDALKLIETIGQKLPKIPEWLAENNKRIIAIGGNTSIFAAAAIESGNSTFTKQEVMEALLATCNKSDEELSYFPEPHEVVIDFALLYAVMDHTGIEQVTHCETNGATEGMLVTPELWQ